MREELAPVSRELSRRAGVEWEIYEKQTRSREIRHTPNLIEEFSRREEGWAARWREEGRRFFAAASGPAGLLAAIPSAAAVEALPGSPWTSAPPASGSDTAGPEEPEACADDFDELSQLLASESHGKARLLALSRVRSIAVDRLVNGAGLAIARRREPGYVHARAAGVAGDARVGADGLYPEGALAPDITRIARSLADRCVLPLEGGRLGITRGDLLLDPAVAAAVAAAALPLFTGDALKSLLSRRYLDREGRFSAPGLQVVDDAAAEGPFDAEGTPTSRVAILEDGAFRRRLHDVESAARSGEVVTGSAVRPSFRHPPMPGATRLEIGSRAPAPARELLARVQRGLYASSLTAPARVDLEEDRYRLEVEGWAIHAGRGKSPIAHTVLAGRFSDLWRRIIAVGDDQRWFLGPMPIGAPTLLVERATFGS
jgi:predicted Zn-dependent protease